MWEVFTCGKMPYGRLKNTEVVERVQRGIVLERPKACFKEVYEVSSFAWTCVSSHSETCSCVLLLTVCIFMYFMEPPLPFCLHLLNMRMS